MLFASSMYKYLTTSPLQLSFDFISLLDFIFSHWSNFNLPFWGIFSLNHFT